MSVIKTSIFTIIDLFPEHREVIRSLFSSSKDFHALCEDFHQCIEALHYWSQSEKKDAPVRRREYLELQCELEREIIRFLNEAA